MGYIEILESGAIKYQGIMLGFEPFKLFYQEELNMAIAAATVGTQYLFPLRKNTLNKMEGIKSQLIEAYRDPKGGLQAPIIIGHKKSKGKEVSIEYFDEVELVSESK